MTREKLLTGLQEALRLASPVKGPLGTPIRKEYLLSAIEEIERLQAENDALRSQTEAAKNDPLTLDELQKMDGEAVWACGISGSGGVWMLAYSDHCENRTDIADYDDYGKTWIACRHKPKEE